VTHNKKQKTKAAAENEESSRRTRSKGYE